MGYAISFGDEKELVWMIANRHADWFVNLLTQDISDKELVKFIKVTTYVSGVSFDHDYGDENYLRDRYFKLLKSRLPEIIKDEQKHISGSLLDLLKELEILANNYS